MSAPNRSEILDAIVWQAFDEDPLAHSELLELWTSMNQLAESCDGEDIELAAAAKELGARLESAHEGSGDDGSLRAGLRRVLRIAGLDMGDAAEESVEVEDNSSDDDESRLMQLFLDSSGDILDTVEGTVLAITDGDAGEDEIALIRRSVHTLKGECGVLGLGLAQSVYHEAESAIDRAQDAGEPLPADLLLEVVDWNRTLLARLLEDQEPLPADSLIARLAACGNGEAPAPDAVAAQAVAEADPEPDRVSSEAQQAPAVEAPPGNVTYDDEIFGDETLPEFLTEALAHLEDAEGALLELEADPTEEECIHRIFRAFHTIKGVAGFLGLEPICDLAHSSETLLGKFRQAELLFTPSHGDLILRAKDMMARLLSALDGGEAPTWLELRTTVAHLDHVAEGGAPDLVGAQSEAVVEAAVSAPAPETEVAAGRQPEPATESGPEAKPATPQEPAQATPEAAAEPTPAAPADASGGDEPVAVRTLQPSPPQAAEAAKQAAPAQPAEPGPRKERKIAVESTIKVNTQRLDLLVDMVGELVIAQQMVVQDPDLENVSSDVLDRKLSQLGKITRDLQEASMSLRMVTFKSTFQKMHRLVRDVSTKAKKKTRFVLEGADTEVDRHVVEKISDPLIHLVRNAIDHGLEPPEARVAAGKPESGTLTLSAGHQGGAVVVKVQDDGRGLAREKIVAKALERGLIPPGVDPAEMSDSAVYKLIFEPGFSTAEAVTDISGRGVGMDVVKRNIEAMRGKIDIQSEPGHGTTFSVMLPLTLAIIDAMLVEAGEQRFVIPTPSIVQSFRPDEGMLQELCNGASMVPVRNRLVPVVRLHDVLFDGAPSKIDSECTLVLVEAMERRVCMVVDRIVGQQQVVIKSLGGGLPSIPMVAGGAVLGDGRIALIVDLESLVGDVMSTAKS